MEKSPNKVILPYQTFQAHCGAVTACAWMAMSDHEVTTGGEDANTCFWNLNNTSQPMNLERSSFMPLRSTGSILSKGILTVSDDNYRWVVLFFLHPGDPLEFCTFTQHRSK